MRSKFIGYALLMAAGFGGAAFPSVLKAAVGSDFIRFSALEVSRPAALAADGEENLYTTILKNLCGLHKFFWNSLTQ